VARKKKSRAARSTSQRRGWTPAKYSHADQFLKLQRWLLPDERIFANLRRHGNTGWLASHLVWLALCWSWSECTHVTDAFVQAAEWCRLICGETPLTTYQGFMHAMIRWTDPLLPVLWSVLHLRMEEIAGRFWSVGDWVPIAFDGSRSTAPRSESNERTLCAPNYGNGQTAKYRKKKSKGMRRKKNEKNKPQPQEPQAWITLLWHMSLRLPWMWKLGPSNASERAHVMEMLDEGDFPKNTLFCGDAGFVGYPLWAQIAGRGLSFLVRIGANVTLLTERTDCFISRQGSLVLCWPLTAQKGSLPALRLRLVKVQIGRQWMWMLTNVLEPSRLTSDQIVKFYKMRWGIEIEFRGLKQTLDRAKLRCRNGQRLLVELHWSLLAMAVAELFALKEQLAATSKSNAKTPPANPKKRSLANTVRAIRYCLLHLNGLSEASADLRSRLRRAVTDNYVRTSSKRARYCPSNPDKKPLGGPKIRKLTVGERKRLGRLTSMKFAA